MLKTAICDLLEIEYPLIAAGMGGIALAELAAAVSEAGALGTIGLAALLVRYGSVTDTGRILSIHLAISREPIAGYLLVGISGVGLELHAIRGLDVLALGLRRLSGSAPNMHTRMHFWDGLTCGVSGTNGARIRRVI
jgi:hypothetical protein